MTAYIGWAVSSVLAFFLFYVAQQRREEIKYLQSELLRYQLQLDKLAEKQRQVRLLAPSLEDMLTQIKDPDS